ncbi:E3 ubiquitin-protein ligase CHFR [Punica granatum]|uniref:E3 ubiquitin-protein ligase CHFR n=2 Tax=Punica granatum TaxID=22663 RepID=A0A6P8EBQ9_PUNGR|nr:E3 ubiquitin-protein ligase CHFR [Punica granatum]
MKEAGECSASRSSQPQFWAKLVSVDSRYPDVEISSDEMVVFSEIVSSSTDKHEWCKITRDSNQSSATLQNKSSSTILVGGEVVQREDTAVVKCGSEIVPGPAREGYLIYKFEIMPTLEFCNNRLKICIDLEHVKCSICLNVWHDVVTVAPCLHNFCNGCFSEWLRRCQERNSSVICPQCRAVIQFVGKNHFLQNIVEDILQAYSSLKRSMEEVAHLNSYASIQSNLMINSGRKRTRTNLMLDEDTESAELPCPQCGSGYGGFRCSQNTVHLQCQICGGMMPSRAGINVPQHCMGCNRAFCCAYWRAQGVTRTDSYPICNSASLKPVSERSISRIPHLAHEKNRHEQDITERCIRQMGRTLQDVISEWIGRFNRREIDRTRLGLNHADMINATTNICNECYDKLVSFLLYWFRVAMPKHYLPEDVAKREDCWYGYACRTQHHNEDHACKRNHVCRPSRGAH